MEKDKSLARMKADLFRQNEAFCCFKTFGSEMAFRHFPEHQSFLEANRDRSFSEVEAELMQQIQKLQIRPF